MNKPFKPPTGVKNAGIRSLLGADNPSSGTDSSNTARCRSSEIFTPPTGVPVKDVKNNKELMRHEHDMTASQPKYSPYPMPPQHINRMGTQTQTSMIIIIVTAYLLMFQRTLL